MNFPDRPNCTVGQLQSDVSEALAKVGNIALAANPIKDVTVTTTTTAVRHGLRGVPSFFMVLQTSGTGPVRRAAESDGTYLYLVSASGTCVVDVMVVP